MGNACMSKAVVKESVANDDDSRRAQEPEKPAVAAQDSSSPLFEEYKKLLELADAKYAKDVPGISAKDALIVVDMQNDFVPKDDVNPDGGAFGVAEGANATKVMVDLIGKASAAGAVIVATRDYHPKDHCSFMGAAGGPFPPHCIQGSKGAEFYPPIKAAFSDACKKNPDRTQVVFKGFARDVDSFGACTYGEGYFAERGLCHKGSCEANKAIHGCSALNWTGAFALQCSNFENDVNAPPDVMAVYERKSLADRLKEMGVERLFVVGLALDYCVLDTALNAAGNSFAKETYMVVDASRAAHIPGIGTFGSGFLNDPGDLVKKTGAQGVKLVVSDDLRA
eukprot:TRINITY_DN7154_c1_g4_i1.p1 TRINITY_DN7154_c1_g4~~TRINITY_DN7154_c1_g4_i1.p1  ORF type:complete len:366 (+),score=68.39 TRINITY_DN7154_c1_g4_i1:86-1099(+)